MKKISLPINNINYTLIRILKETVHILDIPVRERTIRSSAFSLFQPRLNAPACVTCFLANGGPGAQINSDAAGYRREWEKDAARVCTWWRETDARAGIARSWTFSRGCCCWNSKLTWHKPQTRDSIAACLKNNLIPTVSIKSKKKNFMRSTNTWLNSLPVTNMTIEN